MGCEDVGSNGTLKTTWGKPVININGKDVASLPYHAEKGQSLRVRLEKEIKKWEIGDSVNFSVENVQHIALSFGWFVKELSGELINGMSELSKDNKNNIKVVKND